MRDNNDPCIGYLEISDSPRYFTRLAYCLKKFSSVKLPSDSENTNSYNSLLSLVSVPLSISRQMQKKIMSYHKHFTSDFFRIRATKHFRIHFVTSKPMIKMCTFL
jgi:hypothetical protein